MSDPDRRPVSALRFYAYWLLALGAAVSAFCSYIHVRHRVIDLGYNLARERQERTRLEAERRDLRVEMASFEAPTDLARIARDELGLDSPGDAQVIDARRVPGGARAAESGQEVPQVPGLPEMSPEEPPAIVPVPPVPVVTDPPAPATAQAPADPAGAGG
jgi:cell division protein FtsL